MLTSPVPTHDNVPLVRMLDYRDVGPMPCSLTEFWPGDWLAEWSDSAPVGVLCDHGANEAALRPRGVFPQTDGWTAGQGWQQLSGVPELLSWEAT